MTDGRMGGRTDGRADARTDADGRGPAAALAFGVGAHMLKKFAFV